MLSIKFRKQFREQLKRVEDAAFDRGYGLGYQKCMSDIYGKGFIASRLDRELEQIQRNKGV